MGEVFSGINSRVTKSNIQSELLSSSLNIRTRNSKNVINIEISEPPYPPYNDSIVDTSLYSLISDFNIGELRDSVTTSKAVINIEIYENELTKGVCYADVTQCITLIELESPLNNITINTKTVVNLEIATLPQPPYNDSIIDTTLSVLVADVYQPPLFIESTIIYGDIPINKIYYGDIPITKVYKGDTLIKDFNIE